MSSSTPLAGGAPRTRRARPMAPEDRRSAILDAAVPLLLDRGPEVTTRELAHAACVAEGTLFRVFPDKAALIREAVLRALDPSELQAEVAAIEPTSLRSDLTAAMEVVLRRGRTVSSLLAVAHRLPGASEGDRHEHGHGHGHPTPGDGQRPGLGAIEAVVASLEGLLAPHQDALRRPPAVCARLLVMISMGAVRPGAPIGVDLSAAEVVDLVLDGVLADLPAPPAPPADPEPSC